jgi:hypothetical protein
MKSVYRPAIAQFIAHIFQIRISHILNGEDEALLVLIQAFSNVGKDFQGQLLSLLINFRQVDDLRAL